MTTSSQPLAALRRILLVPLCLTAMAGGAAAQAPPERPPPDERSLAYRYDSHLGWFPKASNKVTYTGTRAIHIAHNTMGFRDPEHTLAKTRPRLVFVGDSFVWGYDAEVGERFTDLLRTELASIEVLNLGVSGYGTDQCFLLVQKFFERYDPDAVIYLFSETDIHDNSVNFNYRAYYKPYYVLTDGKLELRGVPVPRASVWSRWRKMVDFPRLRTQEDVTPHLISAMQQFVTSKGASFAVGLIDEQPQIREHLERQGIVFFDLTHVDHRYRYPGHGFHWTPEGHRLVADTVKAFLVHNSASKSGG